MVFGLLRAKLAAPVAKAILSKPVVAGILATPFAGYGAVRWYQAKARLGLNDMTEDELRKLFSEMDADGSGAIDAAELQTALANRGFLVSQRAVNSMIAKANTNHDNVIEIDEFLKICNK